MNIAFRLMILVLISDLTLLSAPFQADIAEIAVTTVETVENTAVQAIVHVQSKLKEDDKVVLNMHYHPTVIEVDLP